MFIRIKGDGDRQRLQDGFNRLNEWPGTLHMLLNFGTKVNASTNDVGTKMYNSQLVVFYCFSVSEYDLRLTNNAEMKVSKECGIAASMGNRLIGLIRRTNLQ